METPLPRQRRLARLLSPKAIADTLRKIAYRMPFTFVFVCVDVLYAMFEINFPNKLPDVTETAFSEALALGTLLSLASYLWCEHLQAKADRSIVAQLVAMALAIGNFMLVVLNGTALNSAHYVGYSSAVVACVVAILFQPPFRDKAVRPRWQYTMGVVEATLLALCVQIVLLLAMMIIMTTLTVLFHFSDYKFYFSACVVIVGMVPAMLFLSRLPVPRQGDDSEGAPYGMPLAAFCKNVLLPISVVYMAILYVYALKIIFTWALPNGQISWMVTALVSGVLVTVYGLQGYLCSLESNPSAKRLAALALRWLPLLTLPLLVMMSVAIFYRIGQYGLTTSRLYVATFNIWAYCAVAYIMRARMPRLNVVAASFAVVFLITSIVPGLNYSTLGTRIVQNKVYASLRAAGVTEFPMRYKDLKRVIADMPEKEGKELAGDIEYLDSWNDHSAVAPIVYHDSAITTWELVSDKEVVCLEEPAKSFGLSPVPKGLAEIRYISETSYSTFAAEEGRYVLNVDSVAISLPVDSLRDIDSDDFRPFMAPVEGSDNSFAVTGISLRSDDEHHSYRYLKVQGYLLIKEKEKPQTQE